MLQSDAILNVSGTLSGTQSNVILGPGDMCSDAILSVSGGQSDAILGAGSMRSDAMVGDEAVPNINSVVKVNVVSSKVVIKTRGCVGNIDFHDCFNLNIPLSTLVHNETDAT